MVGSLRHYVYIYGGDGLAAVYLTRSRDIKGEFYYAHTDHLGSIVSLTDNNGTESFHATYDAWGNQTVTKNKYDLSFYRGYTGHEHLPEFGLINMNGRMYDPLVSRFLSPDPYIQAPGFSQSFNRYSYCLNNPLKYSDESGEFWHIIIGAAVGGVVNLATHWNQIDSFGEGLAAFGVGAVGGALAAASGGAAMGAVGAGGFLGGSVAGGVGYLYGTSFTSMGNVVAFGDRMPTAGQFWGGLGIAMATSGLINGIVDYSHGGDFLTGNGAKFSFDSESLHGVVDADQAAVNTNEQLNQVLNDKGFKLSNYKGLQSIDIESDASTTEYLYYRTNGRLYKMLHTGGYSYPVGGTTITEIQGFNRISYIYLSTHNTIPNLMKTLNHELIHAYQWGILGGHMGRSDFNIYSEASASAYTHMLYPQYTSPVTYYGWRNLWDWPLLLSTY